MLIPANIDPSAYLNGQTNLGARPAVAPYADQGLAFQSSYIAAPPQDGDHAHAHAAGTQAHPHAAAGTGTAHVGHDMTTMAAAGGGGHAHGPQVPPDTATIRSLLVEGSYGPTLPKGKAPTIQIPDGEGFGGIEGRTQNGGDKQQNNYSVTDANFFNTLGVLKNPETGEPFTYVQQIQAYNAAGYVSTFHPDIYAKMVAVQDAGEGSILGMALNAMGVDGAPTDPGMAKAGLTDAMFANENVPGSPLNAKITVMSGTDLAGEEWARPHHAESAWPMYKSLIDAGLDFQTASVLSGDDAVSGAGRMNGFNNQDGHTGFNDDEKAVYQIAARVQQQTGIPVIQILSNGHNHTGIDASAKTSPNIDDITGVPLGSDGTQRANAIYTALMNGKIVGGDVGKYDLDENHRAMAFHGTASSTLADAVAATEAVQPKGVEGLARGASNFFQDIFAAVLGKNGIVGGIVNGLFGGILGAGLLGKK